MKQLSNHPTINTVVLTNLIVDNHVSAEFRKPLVGNLNLKHSLGLESLDIMELLLDLEIYFQITLPAPATLTKLSDIHLLILNAKKRKFS